MPTPKTLTDADFAPPKTLTDADFAPQQNAPTPPAPPEGGNHGLSEFITSPHGLIREGARQIGLGAKELFTPGQRMRGATDVIRGTGSALAPVAMGAAIPALVTAPAAAAGGIALGGIGAGLGQAGGRRAVKALGGSEEAQDFGGELGGLGGGVLAGGAGAKLAPKLIDMIPSADRAGKTFQYVMSKAKDVPVDTSAFAGPALAARKLNKVAGDPYPPVLRKAFQAIQPTTDPLTYGDSRMLAGSAGRKAVQMSMQPQALSGPMKMHAAQLAEGLDAANEGAARSVGVGDEYRDAMTEYRRAMALQQFGKEAGKVALKATPYAVGGGLAYRGGKALGVIP